MEMRHNRPTARVENIPIQGQIGQLDQGYRADRARDTRSEKDGRGDSKAVLTCLSFNPSKRTSSRMVNLGAFPPCLLSSSSRSKSRGSKAILLPPSKAEPACETEALTPGKEEELGVEEWFEPLRPQLSSTSSLDGEAEGATRRRERPPAEVIL